MKLIAVIFALVAGAHGTAALADPIPEDRLSYSVYKANPFSGKPAATIMFGHGCNGVHKTQVSDWVQDLTQSGYNVVVVDSLGPRGLASVCKPSPTLYLRPYERMPEFYAIAERIQKQSWHNGHLGYIGFSHGGSLGIELSAKGRVFDAVVVYYPNCGPGRLLDRSLKIKTQVHVSQGDTWAPMSHCADLTGVTEKIVHQTATHSWDIRAPERVFVGELLRYDPEATRVSLTATRRFFEENLK